MRGVFERVAEESKGCVSEADFSFASHTTAGIGGAAPLCLYPESVPAAGCALRVLKKYGVPYVVLGSGANVLAADRGFDGAVVSTDRMRTISLGGETVYAESGVRAARLLRALADAGLGGFAFMAGIPASVGGAGYMNAGTARGHIGDRVLSVSAFTEEGDLRGFTVEGCAFGYKHTVFTGRGMLIASVQLRAEYCGRERALAEIRQVLAERARLPKGRSMGCVFKNPEGVSAGALIESVGMKGAREGGAFVSDKHANFIINGGKASAKDVRALIERVRRAVFAKTGVALTEEIVYIGED